MNKSQKIVLMLPGLFVAGCASSSVVADGEHHVIPFRLIGGVIPVIKISLNDKVLTIAGIFGSDPLSRYQMPLDYASETLSYKSPMVRKKLLVRAAEQ